ncbi:hypothetical protein ACFQ7N_22585 [Streptomyces niveus]|uniref:hypothetical protein n=1 Tax=Streptomyces niveus TaxID=193462 RepID=UPI00368E6FE1
MLSDRAAGLSEAAGGLAVTRYDSYCGPGGRVSEALRLTQIAERLLAGSVVYERERGSSWEDIAQYLGVEAEAVRERFSPDLEEWNTAFDVPYRLDETGRKRIPQLPTAAYVPQNACRRLDQTSACKAAREAITAGGEVMLYNGQPPQWMVLGIAATRLKRSLKIGLTTLYFDATRTEPLACSAVKNERPSLGEGHKLQL